MGATLSSPQLGDGLITAPGPGPPGPFATAFYVAATDTNSLGFTASVLWGTAMEARYTNTASVEKTVFCSQVQNDPSQTNPFSTELCVLHQDQQLVISHPWFESHQNIIFLADNFLFEGLINNELPLENVLPLQGDFICWGHSICQIERLQTIKKLCEHIKVHILKGHLENHKLQDLVQIDFVKQDNINSPLQHRRYREVAFQSSFYRKSSLSRHSEYQAGIPKLYLSLACIPIVECLFMF
ncbi:hypothetical protein KCU95_g3588, partial [Aureobasidium melanogenum]